MMNLRREASEIYREFCLYLSLAIFKLANRIITNCNNNFKMFVL